MRRSVDGSWGDNFLLGIAAVLVYDSLVSHDDNSEWVPVAEVEEVEGGENGDDLSSEHIDRTMWVKWMKIWNII